MKLSLLTIVAPWAPSSRATYAPAKPPPTINTPPRASLSGLTCPSVRDGIGDRQLKIETAAACPRYGHSHGDPSVGHRQRQRERGTRRDRRPPARGAGGDGRH